MWQIVTLLVVMLNGNTHTATYTDMETCLKYATQFSSMNGVKYAMCSGEEAK